MIKSKHILRGIAFSALLLFTAACTACVWWVFQNSFSSKFSLQELVRKNQSNSGLDCSSGAANGIGAGTGGVGSAGKGSTFHRGESCSCRISDAQQFDEAKFIQTLKESLEKDLSANEAQITSSKNIDATSFAIEYTLGDTSGQVKISGTRGPGNYYSLSSALEEKTAGNQ